MVLIVEAMQRKVRKDCFHRVLFLSGRLIAFKAHSMI